MKKFLFVLCCLRYLTVSCILRAQNHNVETMLYPINDEVKNKMYYVNFEGVRVSDYYDYISDWCAHGRFWGFDTGYGGFMEHPQYEVEKDGKWIYLDEYGNVIPSSIEFDKERGRIRIYLPKQKKYTTWIGEDIAWYVVEYRTSDVIFLKQSQELSNPFVIYSKRGESTYGMMSIDGELPIMARSSGDLYIGNSTIYNSDTDELFDYQGNRLVPENLRVGSPIFEDAGVCIVYNLTGEIDEHGWKKCKFGLYDYRNRKMILPLEYDHMQSEGRDSVMIEKGGLYGVANTKGKIVIPVRYKSPWGWKKSKINNPPKIDRNQLEKSGKYAKVSYFQEGLCWVKNFDGSYGYIDENTGQMKIRCNFDANIDNNYGWMNFSCGLAVFKQNGKMGYINKDGKIAIPARYDRVCRFSGNGIAWATIGGQDRLINTDGNVIYIYRNEDNSEVMADLLVFGGWDDANRSYTMLNWNGKDTLFIKDGQDHIGIYMKNGECIMPTNYKYAHPTFVDNVYSVKRDGCIGFYDLKLRREIIPCRYTDSEACWKFLEYCQRLSPVDIEQNIPETTFRNTNTFAVIIANEDYSGANVANVDYAKKDGDVFKEYCIKTLGIPEKNVHLRTDATLNQIRSELRWLGSIAEAFEKEANVIFYYTGHGIPDEKGGNSYLLPVDGIPADLQSSYSLSELYQKLGALPVKQTIVFIDACFSGAQRDGNMLVSAKGVAIKAKAEAPQGSMVVLSAAQGDETAYFYKQKRHGLFTYYLLKKLQETKGDCTLGELGAYIKSEVAKYSIVEIGKSQTPTVSASSALGESWNDIRLR